MKYWELVKMSKTGVSLWKRTDIRNRYAAYAPGEAPTDDAYGTARKHAMIVYAIKDDRAQVSMEVQR